MRETWRRVERWSEGERDRKWTKKGDLRTIASTTTAYNHQSTLSGTPSLLLWRTWWWGILGRQTPGQGPSPLWRPPLPAGLQNPLLLACQQPWRTQEPRRCSGHTTARLRGVSRGISREPMAPLSFCASNGRTPRTCIAVSRVSSVSFRFNTLV